MFSLLRAVVTAGNTRTVGFAMIRRDFFVSELAPFFVQMSTTFPSKDRETNALVVDCNFDQQTFAMN